MDTREGCQYVTAFDKVETVTLNWQFLPTWLIGVFPWVSWIATCRPIKTWNMQLQSMLLIKLFLSKSNILEIVLFLRLVWQFEVSVMSNWQFWLTSPNIAVLEATGAGFPESAMPTAALNYSMSEAFPVTEADWFLYDSNIDVERANI